MAIKIKIGKLVLATDYEEFIQDAIDLYSLEILHIEPRHTSVLTTMHLFHGDPFDRLLIAQASVEGIPIISVDAAFDQYPVNRLWKYEEDEGEEDMYEEEHEEE